MHSLICPICGGKLHIVVETGLAVCEACGKSFDADPKDVQKYGEIVRDAERLMRQNTVAGYEDAIRLFASVPFVSGAKEKQAECEKRLSELQTRKRRRTESERIGDKRNIRIGVILLILTVLLMAAAIAGIVCKNETLPPWAQCPRGSFHFWKKSQRQGSFVFSLPIRSSALE